jgi:hypothetical protein
MLQTIINLLGSGYCLAVLIAIAFYYAIQSYSNRKHY